LHNELDYNGPFEIKFPLTEVTHTLTYEESGDIAQFSFYIALVALVLDVLVIFFFQNNQRRGLFKEEKSILIFYF